MIEKCKELFKKYREPILYLFFGGCTTIISYAVFILLSYVITLGNNTLPANIISNVCGVIFAYLTNRKWVFKSKSATVSETIKEAAKFAGGRLFTILLDLVIVYIMVDILGGNKAVFKLVSNVITIVLNYLISKFIVFINKEKTAN